MSQTRILIVGAGAVGQAYALGLQRAGVEVSFFVKPHHVERLKKGIPVQEVGLMSVGPLEDLSDVALLTDWDAVAGQTFHSIWLAVDGTALMGDWLEAMSKARGTAAVVAFQTGVGGRERLRALVPEDALVVGMIPFLAWWAPLDPTAEPPAFDPPDPPRMRIWHPPLMRTPLSGRAALVAELVGLLRAGGLSAKAVDNAAATGSMGTAALLPTIAGLEVAGWSLKGFAGGPVPDLVVKAVTEARTVASAITGTTARGPAMWLLRPTVLRLVVRLAPLFAPLDLQTYLKVHFTKVGVQTLHTLHGLLDEAGSRGLPAASLSSLARQLEAARDSGGSADAEN